MTLPFTFEHPNACNYYEIIVPPTKCNELSETTTMYHPQCDKDVFVELLAKVKRGKSYKFSQREYKEYTIGELVCQISPSNHETRVFNNHPLYTKMTNHGVIMGYQKTKMSLINFPSTLNNHQIRYVKKMAFRITNRVFLNFEIAKEQDNIKDTNYYVYINYNHEENVDIDGVYNELASLFDVLQN